MCEVLREEVIVSEMLEHFALEMPNTAIKFHDMAVARGCSDKVLPVIKPLIDKQLAAFWA